MEELIGRLNGVADELHVTSSALRWRLAALRKLNKKTASVVPESALRNNGHEREPGAQPPLFSRPFAELLAAALERGYLSVRRAASLCGLAIEELQELFATHGIEHVIEL